MKPPSVAVMKLSKAQYIQLADQFRDKALTAHQDMRAWMNRAQLAESRLAVLRADYEPQGIDS
jgi:hypothetical protein